MNCYYSVYVPFHGEYAIGAKRLETARKAFAKAFPEIDTDTAHPRFHLQILPHGKEAVPDGQVIRLKSAAL